MLRYFLIPLFILAFIVSAEVIYRGEGSFDTAEYIGTDSDGTLVGFSLTALTAENVSHTGFSDGTIIRVPGEGYGMPIGTPDLPVIRRMVLIPNTGDISVEIVSSETFTLGIFSIPPTQEFPTRSGEEAPISIDRELYNTSELYPASPVRIDRISILRDMRVAWVEYIPVQYNPVTGETVVTTDITVRLVAQGTGENELYRTSNTVTASFIPVYEQVLGFDGGGSDVVTGSYLVIGTTETIGLAQNLIDWKLQKGYQVEYGVVPDIGATASAIDTWIENAFNLWANPPEYLLIVGDENAVPPPYASGTEADNQYGVIGSGVDPSIHVGRICGDIGDLYYQTWKIHSYESDPYEPVNSWFQHAISIGSTDFQDPWMSWRYFVIFMEHEMPTTLYCNQSTYGGIPPTISNISAEVNDGLSLLSYIGHGSQTSWGTTGFSNSDVAALSNGRKLPWVSSIACQNAAFDGSTTCFGEAWMNEGTVVAPKGAIGFMGATMNSPVGPTDSLALYQFRGYFEEEMYHMGAAFDYGKIMAYMYTGSSSNSNMHMIFGCPEFDMYTDTSPMIHIVADHWDHIQPGPWGVTVLASGSPVEGAMVGIVQNDVLLESGYTSASGTVNFDIPTIPTNDDVTITCTYHNLYPSVTSAYVSTGIGDGPEGVFSLTLEASVPNPIYDSSTFIYSLANSGTASLDVYDVSGRLVRNLASGDQLQGTHSVVWGGDDSNGSPVPGGIYLLRLTSGGEIRTQACVVLR